MIHKQTSIKDCLLLQPNIFHDKRGLFTEIYKQSQLPHFHPTQSNCSVSKAGVCRGIHRTPYAKLVTCVHGKVYDVCVDLRKDSDTYMQYFGIELDAINLMSLYIPAYCGHGFLALEDSVLIYHQDQEYNPIFDETYCYKNFNIQWPKTPILVSDKDEASCDNQQGVH